MTAVRFLPSPSSSNYLWGRGAMKSLGWWRSSAMLLWLMLLLDSFMFWAAEGALVEFMQQQQQQLPEENQQVYLLPEHPQLDGAHFRITVLQEYGFLDITDNDDDDDDDENSSDTQVSDVGRLRYSGYLIDMLEALALPERANFTYTLLPPSGYGSLCNPRLSNTPASAVEDAASDDDESTGPYDAIYHTQYNCGASDVNDVPMGNHSTDMYLGLYFVTPARQRLNQFTIPYIPPFSGTLTMMGTATGIADFYALVNLQAKGLQPAACAPGGAALTEFVANSYPGLQVKEMYGGEDEIYQAFVEGTCQVYIVDGPVAAQFVLRRSRRGQCLANGKPIGIIGDPMSFGLHHYAVGIRRDMPIQVQRTLSYWMNILMSCNPLDLEQGVCPNGNLASFFEGQGGSGEECGYVLYPSTEDTLSAAPILGIIVVSAFVVALVYTMFHRYRLRRQALIFNERQKAAHELAERERELNEFIAHEVRNPLSSAIAALSFVSSKAADHDVVPNQTQREELLADVGVIESSLQFVNELLRNMLDLHRASSNRLKLDFSPTDVLSDVLEPVASILFMRGAKIDVQTDCQPESLVVETDRMRLKQIVLNLAGNASKFVEVGFIRLRAEVVVDKGDDNTEPTSNVLIHVEDSGPGIPLGKRDRLFAKFQESLDSLNQGTGVGLSVCRNLSELMGADLFLDGSFESGIEGCPGTRFTLRLNRPPLQLETTPDESNHSNGDHVSTDANGDGICENGSHNEQTSATPDRRRLREHSLTKLQERDLPEKFSVLFVDDDMILRKLFARSLKRVAPTWNLQEAANGETAIRLIEGGESFDLIFMDQYMASVEKQLLGTEAVRLLRVKGVKSVICGLSANDKESQFMEAGANAFMIKPFPTKQDALKHELNRILHPEDRLELEKSYRSLLTGAPDPQQRQERRESRRRQSAQGPILETSISQKDLDP